MLTGSPVSEPAGALIAAPVRRLETKTPGIARRFLFPKEIAYLPNSLFAVSATSLPWKAAPSSSFLEGWRWPWPPAMVVAP